MDYKKQAFYNTAGNLVYMVSIWMISVLTVRLSGFETAGIFSLAMSIGNIFYFFAVYGMRSFQASDSLYQYSPRSYIRVRGLTVSVSALALVVYLAISGYSRYVSIAILLYTAYKFFEAYSDVYFGELQRVGHLEICGISMSLKGILSIAVFCIVLWSVGDLNYALLAMVFLAAVFLVAYDIRGYRKYQKTDISSESGSIFGLLKSGFSMLLTTVFPIIVTAIPRLALEHYCGTAALGVYSSISTPTVLITTLVPNVLAPFMTLFGLCYHEKKYSKLLKMLWIALFCTVLLGLAACVCAYFLGDFAMGLLFGDEILPHLYLFIPLILATTVYALSMAANSVLISIRQPIWLTACSGAALITSFIISYPLVQKFGEMGAVWAFGLPFAVQLLLQVVYLIYKLGINLPRQTQNSLDTIDSEEK